MAVEAHDGSGAESVQEPSWRGQLQVSPGVQVSDRRQGQIWSHNSSGGLGCWRTVLWLPARTTGTHVSLEASDRSQASGKQVLEGLASCSRAAVRVNCEL